MFGRAELTVWGVESETIVEVGCDVAVAGDVENEVCGGVLYPLQSFLESCRGSYVERVAVVLSAADEGLGNRPSGFGWDPPVDFAEHVKGVEAGGRDGVDLLGHGEGWVKDETQVAGVVGGCWCGSQ
ncbi:hypothetical protein NDU88_001677 [Pleurodeles waltl]|uniref:Uncharacterized protein n=1 Tax=Pleurodeles waltl TaxID=8319 RepID=A0AAV7UTG3_PLEWA|nr:hypothetical protein NDU88_001677 [Pleurodeles waltl]